MAFVQCKRALLDLPAEDCLQVSLTDSASLEDILRWAGQHGLQWHSHDSPSGMVVEFHRTLLNEQ